MYIVYRWVSIVVISVLAQSVLTAGDASLDSLIGTTVNIPAIKHDCMFGLYLYTDRMQCWITSASMDQHVEGLRSDSVRVDYRQFISGIDEDMLPEYTKMSPGARIVADEISAYRKQVTSYVDPFWILVNREKKVLSAMKFKDGISGKAFGSLVQTERKRRLNQERANAKQLCTIDLGAGASKATIRYHFMTYDRAHLAVVTNAGIVVKDLTTMTQRMLTMEKAAGEMVIGVTSAYQLGTSDTIVVCVNSVSNYRKLTIVNIRTLAVDTITYTDTITVGSRGFSTSMLYVPATKSFVTNMMRGDTNHVITKDYAALISVPTSGSTFKWMKGPYSGAYDKYKWSVMVNSVFRLSKYDSPNIIEWLTHSNTVRVLDASRSFAQQNSFTFSIADSAYRQYDEDFPFRTDAAQRNAAIGKMSTAHDVCIRGNKCSLVWLNFTHGKPNPQQSAYCLEYGIAVMDIDGGIARPVNVQLLDPGECVSGTHDPERFIVSKLEGTQLKVWEI